MSYLVKNVKVNWTWAGDTEALKGFNVALTKQGDDPYTRAVATMQAGPDAVNATFDNVLLNNQVNYIAWVQAIYEGQDSDWVSTGGVIYPDDGANTLETTAGAQTRADDAEAAAIEESYNNAGVYSKTYSVNTAMPQKLQNFSGTTPLNGTEQGSATLGVGYMVEAVVLGTGTNTGALALFIYNPATTTWTLEKLWERGTSSNHPEFFIDGAGHPALRLYSHTTMYSVRVGHHIVNMREAAEVWASRGINIDGTIRTNKVVSDSIAAAAVIAAKIADGAVSTAKFAAGIEPVSVVSALPTPSGYTGPKTVFLTTDGKLYRYSGGAWSSAVPTADLTGTIVEAQIANSAVTANKIADAAVSTAKFAAGIEPVSIVAALPTPAGYTGPKNVFLTTDGKLYRYVSGAWTTAVAAADIAGTISNTQIADDSISTPKLQANAVTAAKIAANTITANEIAANAITSSELAANSVIAGKIAAGVVTATELAANAVKTDKLTVLATNLVNPITQTGTLNGWGNVLEDGTGTPANVTYDATEKAIKRVTSGNDGVTSQTWRMDHDKIYRVSFKLKKDLVHGTWYAGVAEFATPTGPTESNQSGGLWDLYNASRTLASAGSTNAYWESNQTAQTGYVDYVVYLVGANRSVNECPQHVGSTLEHPYIKAQTAADNVHVKLRFLNWSNTVQTALFIKDVSVTELGAGYIVASNIVAGTITANEIAAATITGAKIAANTITASNIVAGTITANEIAANTITAGQIAASAIGTDELAANAVTAAKIAAGTITANEIAAATILAANIAANTITAAQIAAATITADRLTISELSAITADLGNITAGTVTGALIRTAATGQRFVVDTTSNEAHFWGDRGTANAGTYSQTGTTITVTWTAHGLSTGAEVILSVTTGTADSGVYTVTVTDANTFTVTSETSETTSGNVNIAVIEDLVTIGKQPVDEDDVLIEAGTAKSGHRVLYALGTVKNLVEVISSHNEKTGATLRGEATGSFGAGIQGKGPSVAFDAQSGTDGFIRVEQSPGTTTPTVNPTDSGKAHLLVNAAGDLFVRAAGSGQTWKLLTPSESLYTARAWVNFNGTGTIAIRESLNISSLTDLGTGNYQINFAESMSTANYALTGTCRDSDGTGTPMIFTMDPSDTKTVSAAEFRMRSGGGNTLVDCSEVNAVVFGTDETPTITPFTQNFYSGSGTATVPLGAVSLTIKVWGPGAKGASGSNNGSGNGGAGGISGSYCTRTIAITSADWGLPLSYVIAAGNTSGSSSLTGTLANHSPNMVAGPGASVATGGTTNSAGNAGTSGIFQEGGDGGTAPGGGGTGGGGGGGYSSNGGQGAAPGGGGGGGGPGDPEFGDPVGLGGNGANGGVQLSWS